ncbi:MAG: C25 family cysteine peptidase [bacterium]
MSKSRICGRAAIYKSAIVAFLSLLAFSNLAFSSEFERTEVKILEESQQVLRFKLTLGSIELRSLEIDGKEYTSVSADRLTWIGQPGEPDLPVYMSFLAIPEGGDARVVSFSTAGEEIYEGIRVVPVPKVVRVGDDPFYMDSYEYFEDPEIYESTSSFPQSIVWLKDPGILRNQRVIKIFVAPFIYEPGSSVLRVIKEITVEVEIGGRVGMPRGEDRGEDRWEPLYRNVLLNYEQGKRWRREPRKSIELEQILGAPSVTNPRLKILIDRTGLDRLDYDVAHSAGFPSGLPIDQIFLYQDTFREGAIDTLVTEEIACEIVDADGNGIFSSGDYIIFFARSFYDQFGYMEAEDMYFDKNVYWLSWSEGEHKRIGEKQGWRQGEASRPTGFTDFIHVEKDSFFVATPPYGSFDLFTWLRLRGSLRFDLPGLITTQAAELSAKFIYQLYSYGSVGTVRVNLFIKDCDNIDFTQIHTFTIPGGTPSIRTESAQIPPESLCEVNNAFRFETLDAATGSPFTKSPGVMLDWLEIRYMRDYKAVENRLRFSSGDATGEIEIEINGFSSDDISIYDVTDPANPLKVAISPEQISQDGGLFKVTFRDSIEDEHTYYASTRESFFLISSSHVSTRPAPRLRTQTGEFLLITHPNFADALSPLVAKRQQQYSVVVATTEEVYDDFGNGMKSDVAIKRIIKNGYSGAELVFVLLVGDSNLDRKGILLNPPTGDTQGASDVDYVPTHNFLYYESGESNYSPLPADMWFACLDGEEDSYPDIYIGRLPVGSIEEAQGAVSKIIGFEDSEDAWKRRLLLIADDDYQTKGSELCYSPSDTEFKSACEDFARIASDAVVPPEIVKFYLADCLVNDQPDLRSQKKCVIQTQTISYTRSNCTPALINLLESGAMLAKYSGHSNFQQFAHEQLIYDVGPKGYSYSDIMNLTNAERPFIFAGFGCWVSNFHKRNESVKFMGDAIGEKFVINPYGGACASIGSPKSELITSNRDLARKLGELLFASTPQRDPYGNMIPSRLVFGEVVINMLLYAHRETAFSYAIFGDPAMMIDMGPPLISLKVNGEAIDTTYSFLGETFDTLRIEADIRDEQAIVETEVKIISADVVTIVSPEEYSKIPIVDSAYPASRAYRITYDHIPLLGTYSVQIDGTDYVGKVSISRVRVSTGSAEFFSGGLPLPEGGKVWFGREILIKISRPFAFSEDQISVLVDGIPGQDFDGWLVEKMDTEGKQWKVSFIPRLASGIHELSLDVGGFKANRSFEFVPVDVVFEIDGMKLYDGDYINPGTVVSIRVTSGLPINPEDISVLVDDEVQSVEPLPDSSSILIQLEMPQLEPGEHRIRVEVLDLEVARLVRIASEASIINSYFYPNPFSSGTYLTYILSMEASDVKLSIHTVSGRLVYRAQLPISTGYHEFRWDGFDLAGDRVANGTYLYRIEAAWGKQKSQATGWLVKVE